MPLDYHLGTSTVRIKTATSPGTFADDPDVTDPSVELPSDYLSGDPTTTFAWYLPGRTTSTMKLKVTARDADGLEVAATFTASGFVVVEPSAAEGAGARPTIEDHGEVNGSSAVPCVFDEIGPNDISGLILTDIEAPNATRIFIRAEEID